MDKAEFYREARDDLAGPLDGTRVLDVTTVWSGPMASCVLADFGCEVIRVEMPHSRATQLPPAIPGTRLSWFHQTVNRNKLSVGLDLRVRESAELFLELVRTADILIENFRPGTMDRWGVGFERCRAVKADLVYVSISGWGQFGPKAARGGYDPIIQAASGWMSLNGAVDTPAAKAPTFLADDLAGLHGALAALAALYHRDRTGEGQHVDVSMLDAMLFQSNGFLTLGATDVPLARWGAEVEFFVPSNAFECADGQVYIVVALDKHWRALATAIGHPELATAPGFATNDERRGNRAAVNRLVADWCRERTTSAVIGVLERVEVTVAQMASFADAATDPHVLARDMLQETRLSNGTVAPIVGPAAKFSRTPTRVRSGAPAPGTHTAQILETLAFRRAVR